MTIKELFPFDCSVCNRFFMSYLFGHWINDFTCREYHSELGLCFYDNNLGELHSISVLNPIKNMRKCQQCRKGNQLTEYM